MAYDDEGIWNTISLGLPQGTTSMAIADLNTTLKPTGSETRVQFVFNGEVLDLGLLRALVKV